MRQRAPAPWVSVGIPRLGYENQTFVQVSRSHGCVPMSNMAFYRHLHKWTIRTDKALHWEFWEILVQILAHLGSPGFLTSANTSQGPLELTSPSLGSKSAQMCQDMPGQYRYSGYQLHNVSAFLVCDSFKSCLKCALPARFVDVCRCLS